MDLEPDWEDWTRRRYTHLEAHEKAAEHNRRVAQAEAAEREQWEAAEMEKARTEELERLRAQELERWENEELERLRAEQMGDRP